LLFSNEFLESFFVRLARGDGLSQVALAFGGLIAHQVTRAREPPLDFSTGRDFNSFCHGFIGFLFI
jgi:hypothetical protein